MPSVVVLAGPPCSLKSTLGSWLAQAVGGVHLELDAILRAIFPRSDLGCSDRILAYAIMARATRPILDRRLSPILECTYSRRICRQHVVEGIGSDDRLVVIEMLVSPQVAVNRFLGRQGHSAIDLTAERVEHLVHAYPYGAGSGTVDSEAPAELIRTQLLHLMDAAPALDRARWIERGVADTPDPQ